jgi:hypothetical protein
MSLDRNLKVCNCKNILVAQVLDYVQEQGKPTTDEMKEKMLEELNIAQACRACVNKPGYKHIDISIQEVLNEI